MGNSQSLLASLITDVVAVFAAYIINFVGCDFIYHSFNVQQSIKGSYWFFLGPILYMFGTTIPWIMGLIKAIFLKTKQKLKSAFSSWWDHHDPFKAFGLTTTPFMMEYVADSIFDEENIALMQDNIDYLKSIGRYKIN